MFVPFHDSAAGQRPAALCKHRFSLTLSQFTSIFLLQCLEVDCFEGRFNTQFFCMQKGHLSPWVRTDPCVLMVKAVKVTKTSCIVKTRQGKLCLSDFKIGSIVKGKW